LYRLRFRYRLRYADTALGGLNPAVPALTAEPTSSKDPQMNRIHSFWIFAHS
jgi:hypothetical protein